MAENIPQLPFANERPPAPTQPGQQFSAEDIRSRMAAINNYVNTNQPQILAGIKQGQADQANYISQFKNYTGTATPQIERVQNIVSGNVMSGPNPGLKQVNIPTAQYVDALMNKSKIEQATKSDPYFFARPTSFNASKYGLNYDRYYSHPKFKELGFSMYRDNESLYNANSSWFDDFRRMSSKWVGLAWQGGSGLFKNWGTFGAYGEAEDAAQMENDLSVAMSSKGGAGAWATNFLANSAYTMGIMAEIGLEEGLLMAAAPFTGGASAAVGAARFGQNLNRMGKSMKVMAETLKNAEQAKTFWSAAKEGAKGFGNFINPLTRTTQLGADLFKANSAVNRLDDFAKMKHTFGAFYRDMRELNAVTAESRLEAGFVQNKVANDALNQFVNQNGRMPNTDEAKIISDNALKAGQSTYYANLGAIFASNRIVLSTALGGVPGVKRLMSKSALNSPLYKIISNPNWKKTGAKPVELVEKGLFNTAKRTFSKEYLKSIPSKFTLNGAKSTLGKTVGGGLRYMSANLMEGVQELYQEGVQASATDYYLNQYYIDMYKDPLIAAKHDMWASLSKGFGEQMSGQGLDVFASGFLMGGVMGGVQNKILAPAYRGYMKVSDYMTPGQDSYGEYTKNEQERMQRYVDARNSVEVDRNQYVNWLDENVILQRDLQAEYEKAMAEDDNETAEQAQSQSLFNHVHTLLQTDKYDIFLEQLEDLRQLSPEDLADAFNEDHSKASEISGRLDNAITKAKSIRTRYEAINTKFKNPYNPDIFNKDTEAESYNREVLGYKAFESAKKMAAFNEYSFDEALEKASDLVTKAAASGPLGNVAARDFSVIYDILDNKISPSMLKDGQIKSYMDLIVAEASVLENGTADQKVLGKKKRAQAENLERLTQDLQQYSKALQLIDSALTDPDKKIELDKLAKSILEKMQVIDETTGKAEVDFEKSQIPADVLIKEYYKDVAWDSYSGYASIVGELNDANPVREELENSFQSLLSYNQIKLEAKRASRYVNILADPMSIIQMADRLQAAMSNAAANKTRYHEEAFKKFYDMRNMDDFFNDLLGLKAYFNPEEIDEFLKDGKIPERFIDAGDGSTILKSDPRYNQIIDLIEKYEAATGRTFSGKPSRPKPPAPKPAAEPTAKPTGVPDEETEPGEVTSPLSQYPEDVQEKLKAAHAEAVKDGATSDIVEWIKESPEAATIIKGTKRRKKRTVVTDELEGEITAANPKSISGAGNLILPGKEGWKLSKDQKEYQKGKDKAARVSDLKENPKPEDSPKMTFAKNRGNLVDLLIRRFAEPIEATGISIKDGYLNAKAVLDQKDDSDAIAAFNETFPIMLDAYVNEASVTTGLTVTEGFKDEMTKALKELALELKDFTWYTGFPTMQGTLANQSVAGTPDLIGEKDGEYYIIDFKTSAQSRRLNKALYDRDDQIQQNAYADLFEQNTGKKVNRVFILNLIVNGDQKTNTLTGVSLDRFENASGKETVFIEIPRTSVDELKGVKKKESSKEPEAPATDAIADIERRRQEEIKKLPEGTKSSLKPFLDKIKAKYDAELVAEYRKQEQEELAKAIPNMAKDYPDTYGDEKGKMPDALYAIYKPIYDKYDKLITPLLPAAPAIDTKSDNKTVFRILEKALYEGNDKRYSDLTKEQLQKLSPETRQYLLDLYEKLAPYNSTYQRLGKILDPQTNKDIVTEDQKIKYVTSNYFGGKGRPSSELGSPADPKHKDLVFPVPSAKVIDDFNNILGAKISGEEIAALGIKTETKKADTPAKAKSPTRFTGKLIWAPPGTVDPIVFERYDAVNADDVLKEVLVDTGFMKSGESFEEANMRLVKSDQKDRVNGEFLRKINELKKEGKTIISQNWFLEKQADVISRPSLEKAFDKEVYNKKIKANSFASSQYEESQEEGWESRVNNVEKNTNLSVKELFEKDTKVSQPVQNIMQASDIYALRAIAKQYAASDEDRPKYFYRVDKENNRVTLSPDELYTILEKRGNQLVKRGINGSNDLKAVLMEIENILKPSEPTGTEQTAEEKAELNNAVQAGNDTSEIADEAINLDSEAESKSQKDIDDEFTDSIGCK
jgi:hypothetical protein